MKLPKVNLFNKKNNRNLDIKKGDILIVNFEPIKGSEQGRVRPALVIQNNLLNKYSPLTIVAPITSKIYEKEYPTNVVISKADSLLNNDSTVLVNQMRTIDKQRILKKISSLNNFIMDEVNSAIKVCLSLD
ncbi:MAG TPA: type II toxin-antitoxin system PemK/MazF family toxin [Candidatus Paceibacterota bacterium]|nr:type II toxin-antitoxin system PemK/MazF family toxin [Candidatus Paceibacterota bacterium]